MDWSTYKNQDAHWNSNGLWAFLCLRNVLAYFFWVYHQGNILLKLFYCKGNPWEKFAVAFKDRRKWTKPLGLGNSQLWPGLQWGKLEQAGVPDWPLQPLTLGQLTSRVATVPLLSVKRNGHVWVWLLQPAWVVEVVLLLCQLWKQQDMWLLCGCSLLAALLYLDKLFLNLYCLAMV